MSSLINCVSFYVTICIVIFSISVNLAHTRPDDENNQNEKVSKIAGGTYSRKDQFPWIVSVQATNFEVGYHLCGGTLIALDWVLTAAHCLDSEKPEWLWVVTGEYDMSFEEGTEQRLLVDYFIQHPNYDYAARPYINDVALIHLSTTPTLDTFTALAPLPSGPDAVASGYCEEAGWGSLSDAGGGSDILQYTSVPVLSQETCFTAYGYTDEGQLCAGNLTGGVGFCIGDNGGPLHCREGGTSSYAAMGLMSYRSGCASPQLPGVYMSLPFYYEWISETISYS